MSYTEQAVITPSSLTGSIHAPVSKSAMQRACAAALLHHGQTTIHHPGRSNDDLAALHIIQQLGATVVDKGDLLLVTSNGVQPVNDTINCGESGLGVRMFTPLAALSVQPVHIQGTGSLLTRPLSFFDTVLPQLGVQVQSAGGFLPLQVRGALQPRDIEVDGSLSSQFLTGLLMAYGAAGASGVTITVNHLISKPYIDITLQIMRHFRMPVPVNNDYKKFFFPVKVPAPYKGDITYTTEGDWSGGAFLLVAGAIAGNLTVHGLDINSTQADMTITTALMQAKAGISIGPSGIKIHQSSLMAFQFDATDCPDLFPPLVALAAYCNGDSIIKGISRLAHKESNRGIALQQEFAKMGVTILLNDDVMVIKGGSIVTGAAVDAHNDHRIAMACAVAALGAKGNTTISGSNAVAKSYPVFYNDLQQLGAAVSLITE